MDSSRDSSEACSVGLRSLILKVPCDMPVLCEYVLEAMSDLRSLAETPLIPKAALFLLAGLPLTNVETVVHSMFWAASDPGQSGSALLLPDDGDPAVASWEEYDPLSAEWTNKMNARSASRSTWTQKNKYLAFWLDVAENVFGMRFATFAAVAIMVSVLGVMSH